MMPQATDDTIATSEQCETAVEADPDHHLWDNHGTWFISYTIHPDPLTKERIRHSLKTKCLVTARYRRDLILARQKAEGILALRKTRANQWRRT